MPAERLSMREVLRLKHALGMSYRKIVGGVAIREHRDDADTGHRHPTEGGLIGLGKYADASIQCCLLIADTLMHGEQAFDG